MPRKLARRPRSIKAPLLSFLDFNKIVSAGSFLIRALYLIIDQEIKMSSKGPPPTIRKTRQMTLLAMTELANK